MILALPPRSWFSGTWDISSSSLAVCAAQSDHQLPLSHHPRAPLLASCSHSPASPCPPRCHQPRGLGAGQHPSPAAPAHGVQRLPERSAFGSVFWDRGYPKIPALLSSFGRIQAGVAPTVTCQGGGWQRRDPAPQSTSQLKVAVALGAACASMSVPPQDGKYRGVSRIFWLCLHWPLCVLQRSPIPSTSPWESFAPSLLTKLKASGLASKTRGVHGAWRLHQTSLMFPVIRGWEDTSLGTESRSRPSGRDMDAGAQAAPGTQLGSTSHPGGRPRAQFTHHRCVRRWDGSGSGGG